MVTKKTETKTYSMKSRDAFASLASSAVERLFRKNKNKYKISSIINVEGNKKYQAKDIDLVVHLKNPDGSRRIANIEIKGDTYPAGDICPSLGDVDVGNFFFEIVSNDTKEPRTPGCFMYTESDVVYYLYLTTGTLYQLKTEDVRAWFKEYTGYTDKWLTPETNLEDLTKRVRGLKKTSTVTNDEKKVMYSTWGVTVPIKTVMERMEARGQKIKKLDMFLEVIEAAVTTGCVQKLIEKMPHEVHNRAEQVWAAAYPDMPHLSDIHAKLKLEIPTNNNTGPGF